VIRRYVLLAPHGHPDSTVRAGVHRSSPPCVVGSFSRPWPLWRLVWGAEGADRSIRWRRRCLTVRCRRPGSPFIARTAMLLRVHVAWRGGSEGGHVLAQECQNTGLSPAFLTLNEHSGRSSIRHFQRQGLPDWILDPVGISSGTEVARPRRNAAFTGRFGEQGGGAGHCGAVCGPQHRRTSVGSHIPAAYTNVAAIPTIVAARARRRPRIRHFRHSVPPACPRPTPLPPISHRSSRLTSGAGTREQDQPERRAAAR
jgi:hypothetical protein